MREREGEEGGREREREREREGGKGEETNFRYELNKTRAVSKITIM